jgi:hypothetical protein
MSKIQDEFDELKAKVFLNFKYPNEYRPIYVRTSKRNDFMVADLNMIWVHNSQIYQLVFENKNHGLWELKAEKK